MFLYHSINDSNLTISKFLEYFILICWNYISSFRENNKPYLLIDFSNYLRTNVWVYFLLLLDVWRCLYTFSFIVAFFNLDLFEYLCLWMLFVFCQWLLCSYVLGAVFLQLCKVLRLEEHPIVQKPVDPSLFIYKYTNSKYLFLAPFV